ncbi:hypothetical protein FH972_024437 [Carpinus fangiana]|uniref:Uncharacterized protein n=1 Tax=Carpinus fangiana TaxID=176857 RepID=A0A5N6KYE5_9ROSI|nr:hypothetical protein FH972_024437 [Carpinus fangiana]KAB8360701.1 hypothetical protein FH972_024437 [Carpinus fangiana]
MKTLYAALATANKCQVDYNRYESKHKGGTRSAGQGADAISRPATHSTAPFKMSANKKKVLLKIIILGDSGVGKTSLMNQYVCACLPRLHLSKSPAQVTDSRLAGQQEIQRQLQGHYRSRFPHQGDCRGRSRCDDADMGHGRPREIPVVGRGLLSRCRLLRTVLRRYQRKEFRRTGQLERRVPHTSEPHGPRELSLRTLRRLPQARAFADPWL